MNAPAPHPETPTIRQLLEATVQDANIVGTGSYGTKVYKFAPGYGLEDYVLRVADSKPLDVLLHETSALTPVSHLVAGTHIGQPLMELDNNPYFSIHLRQRGESFAALRNSFFRKHGDTDRAEVLACIMLCDFAKDFAARRGSNPFVPLLEQALHLEASGYRADFTQGNVLFDFSQHRFHLVDQLENKAKPDSEPLREAANRLESNFHTLSAPDPDLEQIYHDATASVRSMIREARAEVLTKYNAAELPKALTFAKITDTSAVRVDHPPHALVTRLNQLRQDAGLAARA